MSKEFDIALACDLMCGLKIDSADVDSKMSRSSDANNAKKLFMEAVSYIEEQEYLFVRRGFLFCTKNQTND